MGFPEHIYTEMELLYDLQQIQQHPLRETRVIEKALNQLGIEDHPELHTAAFQVRPQSLATHSSEVTTTGITVAYPCRHSDRYERRRHIVKVCQSFDNLLLPLADFTEDDARVVLGHIDNLAQSREWGILPHLSTKTMLQIQYPPRDPDHI